MNKFLALVCFAMVIVVFLPAGGLEAAGDEISDNLLIYLPIFQEAYKYPRNYRIYIPAGEFQMGCDPLHNGGYECTYPDELPLHTLYLDAYYIDTTEVTNTAYAQCVDAGECTQPYDFSSYYYSSYYGNPIYADYPVIHVDWYQAAAYCAWTGGCLPTEAEWEKAARGSSTPQAFPWGDQSPDCTRANFWDVDGSGSCVGDTSQVGSFSSGASPYGVLDMAGNVSEWVNDWYLWNYYTLPPYENPTGPISGDYKVTRGAVGGISILTCVWHCAAHPGPDTNSIISDFAVPFQPESERRATLVVGGWLHQGKSTAW